MAFDYAKARAEVAARHRIPPWFTAWTLRFERCPPGDLVERVRQDWTWIRERRLQGRRGERCYEVKLYEVLEYVEQVWQGCWCAYIEIDPAVRRELMEMIVKFLEALDGDIRDFLDPGPDDYVDWFRKFGAVASGLLDALDLGAVSDMVKLGDIVAKRAPLAEKIRELRDILDRMAPFEIFRRSVGRWEVTADDEVWSSGQWRPVHQSVSSIEEIPCGRDMTGWSDGEMREAGWTDIYFSVPLPEWLRERLAQQPLSMWELEQYLESRR
ncbi:MAG TPA: hypothetical protein VF859_14245 [Burkholderiales bacterium]